VPPVTLPVDKAYKSGAAAAADVVAAKPTKVLTATTSSPHALPEATMRTTLLEESSTPAS
jgi:hypothetical protein